MTTWLTEIPFGYGITLKSNYSYHPALEEPASNHSYYIENTDQYLLDRDIVLEWSEDEQQVIIYGTDDHRDYCNRHCLEDDTISSDVETIAETIEYLIKTKALGNSI